jgi:hypothetical protein
MNLDPERIKTLRCKASGGTIGTVPQTCTICRHPQRLQIEQALVSGTTLRQIAGHFGTTKTVVGRHRSHVAGVLSERTEARETARRATLLEDVRVGEQRVEWLYGRAEQILSAALDEKDRAVSVHAIRAAVGVLAEARNFMELRGALTNELGRDKNLGALSIQIVCPSAPDPTNAPRISFASFDAFDAAAEEIEVIGIRQPPV